MDWGMKNRIAKLIRPDTGRAVWLAIDHGYFLGPISKLEEPSKTVQPLLPYTDAIMLTRGILRTSINPDITTSIILRVSGGNSILSKDLSCEAITTSLKDAIRLNVAAVAFSIYLGSPHEHQTLINLSNLINEGQDYGIPVLAVTAVGRELEKRDVRFLSLSCRIAAELGAHMVKTYYCDGFDRVTKSCPVPVVIAGGPKLETELDVLKVTFAAIKEGACGVDMGRNIWQSNYPVAMIRAIRSIVHEGSSVKEAHNLFNRIKNKIK